MKIELIQEYEISPTAHAKIIDLKNRCFPDHRKPWSYYKQLPHFRFLVYDDTSLIAHMGVDHRVIAVGDQPRTIFGIVDLCVDPQFRDRGIASELLDKLSELARRSRIDFLFAIVNRARLYERNGFQGLDALCLWLRINDHKNYGVAVERIANEIMVKQIGGKGWVDGPIDLLGYMF